MYQGESPGEGNHLSSGIWDVRKQKELLFIKTKEKMCCLNTDVRDGKATEGIFSCLDGWETT